MKKLYFTERSTVRINDSINVYTSSILVYTTSIKILTIDHKRDYLITICNVTDKRFVFLVN